MKKLFDKIPSAGGLKSKIDGLMFAISVIMLVADCLRIFKQSYAELSAQKDDESGKSSSPGTAGDGGSAAND